MSASTVHPTSHSDPAGGNADVLRWRLEQLRHAGYSEHDASLLAERTEIDLHVATGLLRKGCPAATALRILL